MGKLGSNSSGRKFLLFSALAVVGVAAQADLVWSSGNINGNAAWLYTDNPAALEFDQTAIGQQYGQVGSAFSAVSISGGYIKSSLTGSAGSSSTSGLHLGSANTTTGLEATINLIGPQDTAGVVAVTLSFDGTYSQGTTTNRLQIATGPGTDGSRGFPVSGTDSLGFFDWQSYGASHIGGYVSKCNDCSYNYGNGSIHASTTAYLPFDAGATSVIFAANIYMSSFGSLQAESLFDGSHTATFSVAVPDGFTYSTDLAVRGDAAPSGQMPEPSSLALFGVSGLALGWSQRRRRFRTSDRDL